LCLFAFLYDLICFCDLICFLCDFIDFLYDLICFYMLLIAHYVLLFAFYVPLIAFYVKERGKKYGEKSTGESHVTSLLVKHAHGITSGCSPLLSRKCYLKTAYILLIYIQVSIKHFKIGKHR
jgi:hypothetical protein